MTRAESRVNIYDHELLKDLAYKRLIELSRYFRRFAKEAPANNLKSQVYDALELHLDMLGSIHQGITIASPAYINSSDHIMAIFIGAKQSSIKGDKFFSEMF